MIPKRWQGVNACAPVNLPLPAARKCAEEKKDEGKGMSTYQNRTAKLIAALGILGLMMVCSVPKVSAQVTTFSDANYSGRYGCELSFDEDFFTAVYKYNPDGAGGYANGTMIGSLNNFVTPYDNTNPAGQFCTFFLETAASAYSVAANGIGNEILLWTPSIANPAGCPIFGFIDETFIALRNITSGPPAGASIRAEVADRNLFGIDPLGDAGHGSCLK